MNEFEPRIIAFLCNWCSYAGADLAGVSRFQYPPNVRIIRVMCSGRVTPRFITRALQQGADGVLVAGCHPGDCHYLEGNLHARRKLNVYREMLDLFGIEKERLCVSWISASEGAKFGALITQFVEDIKKMGPQKKLTRRQK